MKVIVIGGFLGSGKTTVLLQLASYLVERTPAAESCRIPVVILENEISENGVDNQLLSRNNFTVENMFSGCICCTSSAQLSSTVAQIDSDYQPEWLIIEATGLAYPDSILATLQDELSLSAATLAIVDTKRWKKVLIAMEQFITAQLSSARVVLLTKVDTVDAAAVESVAAAIPQYAEQAMVCPICATEPQPGAFWETVMARLM